MYVKMFTSRVHFSVDVNVLIIDTTPQILHLYKMMAPDTMDTTCIDSADALVELSGAVLFQGDAVSEVLANGDHVKAISP